MRYLGEPEAHQAVPYAHRDARAFARVYIFVHPIFWGPYAYLVDRHGGRGWRPPRRCRHDSVRVPPERADVAGDDGAVQRAYRMEDPFFDAKRTSPRGGTRRTPKRGGRTKRKRAPRNGTREEERKIAANEPKGHGRGLDTRRAQKFMPSYSRAVATEVVDADRNACGGGPARSTSDDRASRGSRASRRARGWTSRT